MGIFNRGSLLWLQMIAAIIDFVIAIAVVIMVILCLITLNRIESKIDAGLLDSSHIIERSESK